jgi:hypothetical protein
MPKTTGAKGLVYNYSNVHTVLEDKINLKNISNIDWSPFLSCTEKHFNIFKYMLP